MNSFEYNNKDKNIENKVRFFLDYIYFANRNIGTIYSLELENHLSLLEKIIFQIENNHDKSCQYVINHLENDLFSWVLFNKKYKSFSNIRDLILTHKHDKQKRWVQFWDDNKAILGRIKRFYTTLQQTYKKFIVDHIVGFLTCKHNIDSHKEDIIILTKILVSELRFNYVEEDGVKQLIEDSLFNGKLDFKDILSLTPSESYFITRIHDLKTNKDIIADFTIGTTNFVSLKSDKFKSLFELNDDVRKAFIKGYLDDCNSIVAIERIKYYDKKKTFEDFINIVKHNLEILNNSVDSFCSVEPSTILTTEDFITYSYYFHSKYNPKKFLYKNNLDSINRHPSNLLKEINSKAKGSILEYEEAYQQAISNSNSTVLLRQYLESIFWQANNFLINKIVRIEESISSILLLSYKTITINKYGLELINTLQHKYSASDDRYRKLFKISLSPLKNFPYKKLKPYISTDYEQYIYDTICEIKTITSFPLVKDYFVSILQESYELRNQVAHSGRYNERLKIKMQVHFPILVYHFRNTLVSEIKKDIKSNLTHILQKLYVKSNKLL